MGKRVSFGACSLGNGVDGKRKKSNCQAFRLARFPLGQGILSLYNFPLWIRYSQTPSFLVNISGGAQQKAS
ncbi:hypothetical protein RRG08_027065 [Elysia crispata]|uniref:Uncharacterized protein n=1 Tax=Elysia crispata TaxID=231223 RepID=A0AAE0ZIQ6_9GAST|nr:hypothetical protein RRG08_027065 [Elysia crispata]